MSTGPYAPRPAPDRPPGHGDHVPPGTVAMDGATRQQLHSLAAGARGSLAAGGTTPGAEYQRAAAAEPGVGTDQIRRRNEFIVRHPEVSITSPRVNETGKFRAQWENTSADPAVDGTVSTEEHEYLMFLMDRLEAIFR